MTKMKRSRHTTNATQAKVCENPGCGKPPVPKRRYCSMCLLLAEANGGTVPPAQKP